MSLHHPHLVPVEEERRHQVGFESADHDIIGKLEGVIELSILRSGGSYGDHGSSGV
jgi:hypothetical protein